MLATLNSVSGVRVAQTSVFDVCDRWVKGMNRRHGGERHVYTTPGQKSKVGNKR